MAHIRRRGISAIGEEPGGKKKERKNERVIYFVGERIIALSLPPVSYHASRFEMSLPSTPKTAY